MSVMSSYLLWDDVECARCEAFCGQKDDLAYVTDEGMVCTRCITEAEVTACHKATAEDGS